jgi:hypothetical protein
MASVRRDVPALLADGAEILAVDHHVFVAAFVRGRHLRPMRDAMLAGISGEFRRDDVGMDVDGRCGHLRPVKFGLRFSMKARTPSA